MRKIVAAIEVARTDWDSDTQPEGDRGEVCVENQVRRDGIERGEEPEETDGDPPFAWATPYVESRQEVPSSTPIPKTGLSVLEGVVTALIRVEGPIHKDEIARRITSLWGLQRTGDRIAEAVSKAVEAGVRSGDLRTESEFVSLSRQPVVPVRNRSGVAAASLKKPEMIPPSELRQAILYLVTEQVGLRREELPSLVGRALGFKTTSAKLREVIENVLSSMLEKGEVALRDEKLFLTDLTIQQGSVFPPPVRHE